MTEWKRLLAFADRRPGAALALATLVSRQGSSYRAPGARMVIAADGSYEGCLSGGCLEDGIAEVARRVLASGQVETLRIDTHPHFGCPGVLTILVEPFAPAVREAIGRKLARREPLTLVTATGPVATGTRVAAEGELLSLTTEVLVEQVGRLPRLVVVSSTSDAAPVCLLAAQLGWDVNQIDSSAPTAGPGASGIACRPEEVPARFVPDPQTAVLVMTHHLGRDLHYLHHILPQPYRYIGLLGSQRRRSQLLAELGEYGVLDDDTLAERFHSPVGLDIGAETPHAIALAIIAEIHAVWQGREGGSLRVRRGRIHDASLAG